MGYLKDDNGVKDISELPYEVRKTLYGLGLVSDRLNTQMDEYINWYGLVVVDDDVYCSSDPSMRPILRDLLLAKKLGRRTRVAVLAHAVIKGGKVLKNRYGHTNA